MKDGGASLTKPKPASQAAKPAVKPAPTGQVATR